MSLFGPLVGILSLFVIGLGFFWVIRAERSLGWRWWYVFMAADLVLVLLSIFAALVLLPASSASRGLPSPGAPRSSRPGGARQARMVSRDPRPRRDFPLYGGFSRE